MTLPYLLDLNNSCVQFRYLQIDTDFIKSAWCSANKYRWSIKWIGVYLFVYYHENNHLDTFAYVFNDLYSNGDSMLLGIIKNLRKYEINYSSLFLSVLLVILLHSRHCTHMPEGNLLRQLHTEPWESVGVSKSLQSQPTNIN